MRLVSSRCRSDRLRTVYIFVMNPGAETFTVQLSRDAAGQPWGFRLQGGADFATPLSVQSVSVVVCYFALFEHLPLHVLLMSGCTTRGDFLPNLARFQRGGRNAERIFGRNADRAECRNRRDQK